MLKQGLLELDSPDAKLIGFTSDKFGGYLFVKDSFVYISAIISKQQRQGNFKRLVNAILDAGYGVKVPNAFPLMTKICVSMDFSIIIESEIEGDFERNYIVLIKEAKGASINKCSGECDLCPDYKRCKN